MTIVYYATAPKNDEINALKATGTQALLLSFALWKNKPMRLLEGMLGYRPKTVILDPGVVTFSGKNISTGICDIFDHFAGDSYTPKEAANEIIDWALNDSLMESSSNPVYEYISYAYKNRSYYDYCLTFDDMFYTEASFYMYKVMREMDLNILPVFQYQQDIAALDQYVKEGYDLIALGGTLKEPKINKRDEWIQMCIDRHPGQKFHVLGTQRKKLIKETPDLYSCDGNWWKLEASYKKNRLPGQTKLQKTIYNIQQLQKVSEPV